MTKEGARYLCLHLTAHLPFVCHAERAGRPEEGWLQEAVAFSFLPLLRALDRLADDGVRFRLSLALSPPLVAMLRQDLLVRRCARALERHCEVADREVRRTRRDPALHPLAVHYRDEARSLSALFSERYRRDLVGAFRRLQDAGLVEIATSAATHAFLPLLAAQPEAVRAQVAVAVSHYRRHFGREPPGFWLPECGHYPGVGELLAESGLRYFFVDAHGVGDATPRPRYGVFAPISAGGAAAFGRDPESSAALWGSDRGYPRDPAYRDFYRDIGWDLEWREVEGALRPGGRRNLGIKYFANGGGSVYDPRRGAKRAEEHAARFLADRNRQLAHLSARMAGASPVVVAPCDAELFGHWWYEGPRFLESLLRGAASDPALRLATPSDYLAENPEVQLATPPFCSWGGGGYAGAWLDGSNDWIWRHLHQAAGRMAALATDFAEPDPLLRRALEQAAREVLLAQSSDWAFMLRAGTSVDYAIRRIREHLLRFARLHDQIRAQRVDPAELARVESADDLFPEIDYRAFRRRP